MKISIFRLAGGFVLVGVSILMLGGLMNFYGGFNVFFILTIFTLVFATFFLGLYMVQ